MTPIVWAVVVHFNGEEWIRNCLQSLCSSTLPVKVAVIDNASTTQAGIDIIQSEFPQITFIQSKENAGFGRANNIGMQLAVDNHADFVFLLNQDAWIEPDTIEKLVAVSEQNPAFGIISPFHLNAEKSALESGFSNYLRADKCPNVISDIYLRQAKSLYPLPFVNAAAWLITKQCLQTVGGFDPMFFMYGEDVDYCNRVIYHRFSIGVSPVTTICHARVERKVVDKRIFTAGEKYKTQGYLLAVLKDVNASFLKQASLFLVHLLKFSVQYTSKSKPFFAGFSVLLNWVEILKSRTWVKRTKGYPFKIVSSLK